MSCCNRKRRRVTASQRNQLIEFWAETRNEDENLDTTANIALHKKAWAYVQAPAAREDELYGAEHDIRVMLFTLPYDSTITSDMRIKWQGREHNISEIRHDGGPDMIIKAISGVAM